MNDNMTELLNVIVNAMGFNGVQSFYIIKNLVANVEECGNVTNYRHYTVDVEEGEPRLEIFFRNGDNQQVF